MNDNQLYMAAKAARYAQAYLRKLKQWKDGKIELTVEGCDPPYCPSIDELEAEMADISQFIDDVDDLLN
jgi:hypothetical protein